MPLEVHYQHRRVQEEILEEFPFGVVTRNRVGCEILNVPGVMFVDWDIDARVYLMAQTTDVLTWVRRRIFGFRAFELEAAARECKRLRYQRLRDQLLALKSISVRLYETHSGFRGIITSSLFNPRDDASQMLLHELGADPLYARLCKVQGTFRARLTPKFWRLGLSPPFLERHRSGFTPTVAPGWLERYAQASRDRAVCRFVAQFGPEASDPTVQAVIALHDARCRTGQALELA
jgi:hypothetical protein